MCCNGLPGLPEGPIGRPRHPPDRADTARADADRDRLAAEKTATRLKTQIEQAHDRINELSADRDRLTEAARAVDPDRAKPPRPRARTSTRTITGPAGSD